MKFKYLIYKDILLIIRDRSGVLLMFLMPLLLVFIMTVVQDSTFKALEGTGVKLIMLNNDNDSIGFIIERELINSEMFDINVEQNLSEDSLKWMVAQGMYKIGIVIPEKTSERLRYKVKIMVAKAFANQKSSALGDTLPVRIYFDPTTQNMYKTSIMSVIKERVAEMEKRIVVGSMVSEINKRLPQKIDIKVGEMIHLNDSYAKTSDTKILPNSIQHNVPAWTLFAMFFIVISFAGNMVNERRSGSFRRILTMPVSYAEIIFSKILVYLVICLLQFVSMILMGIYILPLIGMPSLSLGGNYFSLIIMALASAMAAIGYALLVGTLFKTYHQATSFGSLSVVILSALGGIWVPVFAMPKAVRLISSVSPLNWGINGFYEIFVRDGGANAVLTNAIYLTSFFVVCLFIAILYNNFRGNKIS